MLQPVAHHNHDDRNSGRIREKGLLYVLTQVLLTCVLTCNPVITYYGDTVEVRALRSEEQSGDAIVDFFFSRYY